MRHSGGLFAFGTLLMVGTASCVRSAQLNTAPQSVTVYVRDFELAVPTVQNIPQARPTSGGGSNRSSSNTKSLTPAQQVNALQAKAKNIKDFVANTLVETLRKSGYASTRNQGRPAGGVLLEGVFAEPDAKNRVRRALLGGGAPGTKFILYVGTFDQKSVDQPLYKEAPAQTQDPDEHYGPVITLNAYVPLAKYEIDKEASEEQIQKVCRQIAENLTELLSRNPAAAQSE